jgi:hypothetical protein
MNSSVLAAVAQKLGEVVRSAKATPAASPLRRAPRGSAYRPASSATAAAAAAPQSASSSRGASTPLPKRAKASR